MNQAKRRIFLFLALGLILIFLIFYLLPAFRGNIEVEPNISLGFIKIHLYGLTVAAAVLVGYLVARANAGKFGLTKEFVEKALLPVVAGGVLGARLYFVAFSWDYFRVRPEEIFAFWHGGLSIFGALLGGTAAGLIFARLARVSLLRALDLGFLVLPLGQAIGRWGNFFNQEAFGRPTNLPWKMYIAPEHRGSEYLTFQNFHPAFLYESLWNIGVFLILLRFIPGKPGLVGSVYLALYGAGRFIIEPLRVDSFFVNSVRVDQAVSLAVFLLGTAMFIYLNRKNAAKNH